MNKEEATKFFSEFFGGEHHFPSKISPCGNGWRILTMQEMATYDFGTLTKLVVLAHDHCVRAAVRPSKGMKLEITIHKRKREGSMFERHPTLEDSVEQLRTFLKR